MSSRITIALLSILVFCETSSALSSFKRLRNQRNQQQLLDRWGYSSDSDSESERSTHSDFGSDRPTHSDSDSERSRSPGSDTNSDISSDTSSDSYSPNGWRDRANSWGDRGESSTYLEPPLTSTDADSDAGSYRSGDSLTMPSGVSQIPTDCVIWFDGCNTCIVSDGEIISCPARMPCLAYLIPECRVFIPDSESDENDCLFACTMDYSPVCGSDGVTYGNDCNREAAACQSATEISVACQRECPCESSDQIENDCLIACPRNYDPICGSDGVTYGNECTLEVTACETVTEILPTCPGECPCLPVVEPSDTTDCDIVCLDDYSPVCGSDGITYGNDCNREVTACLSGTEISTACHGGCPCAPEQRANPDCLFACPLNYLPVCGSDGNTYSNECGMDAAACQHEMDIFVECLGECPCNTQEQSDCLFACTADYRPVCGSDDVTYANDCNLLAASCQSAVEISVGCDGECPCSEQTNQDDCLFICTADYSPVCGSDGITYSNGCHLDASSCQSADEISISCNGECPCEAEIHGDCVTWFDGCNTCLVLDGQLSACTLKFCPEYLIDSAYCIEFESEQPSEEGQDTETRGDEVIVPAACTVWFDGCNTCFAEDGQISGCTKMSCEVLGEHSCLKFDDSVVRGVAIPPAGCVSWFDGCNTCMVDGDQLGGCTKMACFQMEPPKCLEFENGGGLAPPKYCVTWFDGCNTCMVGEGDLMACTEMACGQLETPECLEFDTETIPVDCKTWFDGCNTCLVDENAQKAACSRKSCDTYSAPKCLQEQGQGQDGRTDDSDVPEDCDVWFDGCNTCLGLADGNEDLIICTRKTCESENVPVCLVQKRLAASDFRGDCFGCLNNGFTFQPDAGDICTGNCAIQDTSCFRDVEYCESPYHPEIPYDCLTWFDGCNSCIVQEAHILSCTRMACEQKSEQLCLLRRTANQMSPSDGSSDIPEDCLTWFDGCNTCFVENGFLSACTLKNCEVTDEPKCVQFDDESETFDDDVGTSLPFPPGGCVSWFDGCNTCGVAENGELTFCTLMFCQEMQEPYCKEFA